VKEKKGKSDLRDFLQVVVSRANQGGEGREKGIGDAGHGGDGSERSFEDESGRVFSKRELDRDRRAQRLTEQNQPLARDPPLLDQIPVSGDGIPVGALLGRTPLAPPEAAVVEEEDLHSQLSVEEQRAIQPAGDVSRVPVAEEDGVKRTPPRESGKKQPWTRGPSRRRENLDARAEKSESLDFPGGE
jgi:hypothetical protein